MNNPDPLKNIRVVLARPSHPGNIGATARAMKTMGLGDLRLIQPRYFPHADADARASGARDVLERAIVHADLASAIGDCVLAVAMSSRHRELRHDSMDARAAAGEIVTAAAAHPVALVFGNETSGLSGEEAGLCQIWAAIPANPGYASLNLAAAVQVIAYEIRMACVGAGTHPQEEFPPASLRELESLYRHFEQTMTHSGFFDPENPKRLLPRLRRMLSRARLEAEEVNIWRGFLKSVDKLRR